MGVFKAAEGALGGVLADQWLEYFSCESVPATHLAVRGHKHTSDRSANVNGADGVISSGSIIAVGDGQCAVAVEAGKVLGVYETPGEHKFVSERTGSLFSGAGLGSLLHQTVERIGFGGDAGITQTVLYLNMKEIPGNPFDFKRILCIKSADGSFELDVAVRFAGVFSFRITDPLTFYKNVCRGAGGGVTVESVLPHLTEEFASAAAAALADLCTEGLSLVDLAACTEDVCKAIGAKTTEKWESLRGFQVVSCAIAELEISEDDRFALKQLEIAKTLSENPALAAGYMVAAQADAMRGAALNPRGLAGLALLFSALPWTGFQPATKTAADGAPTRSMPHTPDSDNIFMKTDPDAPRLWRCSCGALNTTKFCEKCGAKASIER